MEREDVYLSGSLYKHNYSKQLFCLNVYSLKLHAISWFVLCAVIDYQEIVIVLFTKKYIQVFEWWVLSTVDVYTVTACV